ncbi:hypothetical protein [Amycolatopsis nigrescens]|uniref:hypothetical protein n=1 Tax=Amycolatopsis nigrescens TaxID=381445 RepID=UPI00146B26BF|nr:hypothetical protein [Amycolatopsis nigrescens]
MESLLAPANLTMVFLVRDDGSSQPRPMPTVPLGMLNRAVTRAAHAGVQSVKLFSTDGRRDPIGSAGRSPHSLMAQAIHEVKVVDPSVTVLTETCLCSYTASGECYIADRNGTPDVTATIDAIAEQAVAQADAGADVVGPASMLGGSVRKVRQALDETGHAGVKIMPHLIFDSRLYEGYRQTMGAVPVSGPRRAFQLAPSDSAAAIGAAAGLLAESADMLLLEPALFCADVLVVLNEHLKIPLAPFSVSGEYTMLGANTGNWDLLIELFTMLRRAGADSIITYAAVEIAEKMGN